MTLINSAFSEQAVARWSKLIAEQAHEPLWFKQFMPESEPISRKRRILNRISSKWSDIKFAYGIVFKGIDPYDY